MTARSLVFGSASRPLNAGWAVRGAGKAGGRSGEIVRDGRIEVHPDPIGARVGDAVGRCENDGGRDEDAAASALVDTVVVQRHEPDVRVRDRRRGRRR